MALTPRSAAGALRSCGAVLLLAAFGRELRAQISEGGIPLSFVKSMGSRVATVVTGPVDVDSLLAEDARNEGLAVPYRFGYPFDVAYGLGDSGTWDELPGGDRLWRLRIECPGAFSINLIYDEFLLPEGADVFVYNDDGSSLLGAFTARNNKEHGSFATAPTLRDACVIELFEPRDVRGASRLRVGRIVHGYRDVFSRIEKDFGDSGSCHVNVRCPEGDEWELERRSVALILSQGWALCTGVLVNNVRVDETPYFLTADHCLPDTNPGVGVQTWVVLFNYESPNCSNVDGPRTDSVSGTTLLSRRGASDFALLRLSEAPPDDYRVYYAGWSAEGAVPRNTTCIHHPRGDIKKISFDLDPAVSSVWPWGVPTAGSHWMVVDWDVGATEPGSSGSPLFDENHHIVGQLTGGESACGNDLSDFYGKFSMSWDAGSGRTSRLHDWLDPDGTGQRVLDGFDPADEPPTIDIASPEDDSIVSGTVTIAAEVQDDRGVVEVAFSVDGEPLGTDSAAPFQQAWDTSGLAVGAYTLAAVATDTAGHTVGAAVTVHISGDCNDNGTPDLEEIRSGASADCNGNELPDECEIASGESADCNGNGVPDACDVAPGEFSLDAPQHLAAGTGSRSVAASDLDGDGDVDLAVANEDSNDLSLLLRDGDGSFAEAVSVPVGMGPTFVTTADLDGNPGPELIVAVGGRDEVIVLVNDGAGGFGNRRALAVRGNPQWVAVDDLDADDDLDLAVANFDTSDVTILLNAGDGSFAAGRHVRIEGEVVGVAAGDVTGDGRSDLAVVEYDADFVLLLVNRGGGSFGEPELIPLDGRNNRPAAVAAGDWDGDGDVDLAVANQDAGDVTVLLNAGGGDFGTQTRHAVGGGPCWIGAFDIDHDGDPDLVAADGDAGTVSLLLGGGAGGFAEAWTFEAGGRARGAAAGDLTGSAWRDLAVATGDPDGVAVLANLGRPASSRDCNANGEPDECDIARGILEDANGNGIADICDDAPTGTFVRGDVNADGIRNIADAIFLLGYLFGGGATPTCMDSGDANDDGIVNISDAVSVLAYLFSGSEIPDPSAGCGADPTKDGLDCASFPPCP